MVELLLVRVWLLMLVLLVVVQQQMLVVMVHGRGRHCNVGC